MARAKIEENRGQREEYHSIMNTVDSFKSTVKNMRDVLRACAVTGMDSMRHICLYILARTITEERARKLDIPVEFSWERLFALWDVKDGAELCLEAFYNNKGAPCLVTYFDRLFETQSFQFEVKTPQRHRELMELLNPIQPLELEKMDTQMDVLGWVYEQHLKTGSTAARDLGQFFTDRSICEYMVQLCRPTFKRPGVPESVCDPSMGTGGFLMSYMKYFKKMYPRKPVDWSVQNKEIHGYDNDAKVAAIARLNFFLESGGSRATNLYTKDSLYGDLDLTGYDVILANMPFGLKGLKHADCCDRVKDLKLRGTKSEPLFLQLMMIALNPRGRCAVVVPDGMLVNASSCHNETRKYLLDNFELKRVIKMKGQFFMNTGIQPSILFFEKTGKPTEIVEFWEVVKGEKGEITETMVVSVPRTKIDASCTFDMRRYMESDTSISNPTGFPIVKLSQILTDHPVKKPIPTTNADGGAYTLFSSSCDVFRHSVAEFQGRPYLLQGSRGTISKATHYCDTPFSASNNVFVLSVTDPSSVSLKYIYYFLRLNNVADQTATTSVIPMLTKTLFREIQIPLPPLPIQNEIVKCLDKVYSEFGDSILLTQKAWDMIQACPKIETYQNLFEALTILKKTESFLTSIGATLSSKISL